MTDIALICRTKVGRLPTKGWAMRCLRSAALRPFGPSPVARSWAKRAAAIAFDLTPYVVAGLIGFWLAVGHS